MGRAFRASITSAFFNRICAFGAEAKRIQLDPRFQFVWSHPFESSSKSTTTHSTDSTSLGDFPPDVPDGGALGC